jgi:hypothetical protein
MTDYRPDFETLVGDDLPPDEHERLLRVHELLLEAGPPPELSPELAATPKPQKAQIFSFPRRRRTVLMLAASLALAVFAVGWLGGEHQKTATVERTVRMNGAGGARASLDVYTMDKAGNWPMKMSVNGLPELPAGQTYALWLTKDGRLESPCGTFSVGPGTTTVRLNAPYHLKEYSGWVVVRTGTTAPLLTT